MSCNNCMKYRPIVSMPEFKCLECNQWWTGSADGPGEYWTEVEKTRIAPLYYKDIVRISGALKKTYKSKISIEDWIKGTSSNSILNPYINPIEDRK